MSSLHQGRATYSDKLFKFRNGRFEDLLSDDINEHRDVANRMAGRSVACVDRKVQHTRTHTHTHTDPGIGRFTLHTHTNSPESSVCVHAWALLFVYQ